MFGVLIIEKNNNCDEYFGRFFLLPLLIGHKCVKINVKAFYKKCAGVYGKAPAYLVKLFHIACCGFFFRHATTDNGISRCGQENTHQGADVIEETIG